MSAPSPARDADDARSPVAVTPEPTTTSRDADAAADDDALRANADDARGEFRRDDAARSHERRDDEGNETRARVVARREEVRDRSRRDTTTRDD